MTFQDILNGLGNGVSGIANFIGQIPSAIQGMDTMSKRLQSGLPAEGPAVNPPASNFKGVVKAASVAPTTMPVAPAHTPQVPTQAPATPAVPSNPGFHIPNIPDNIAQVIGQVFQNQGLPMDATSSAKVLSHPYGPQISGAGRGENPDFKTILDIANRIDSNGQWNDNAPIAQIYNPNTKQNENSIDRGLWRVNNGSFYDYMRRFPDIFKANGINSYADMNDPFKNSVVGKLILQHQGGSGFFAAPQDMANFGRLP